MHGAKDLDIDSVKKADKDEIAREMVALAKNTPGTIGDAYLGRKKLNAMAGQIEWETSRRGDNDGVGRIHALFSTFAAAIYKCDRLNRLIRRWADLPVILNGETQQGRKSMFLGRRPNTQLYLSGTYPKARDDDPDLLHGARFPRWK